MYATTTEAALAVALITAGVGWLGGLSVQRATRARDHYARIWDRQVEVYETVLSETDRYDNERIRRMRQLQQAVIQEKHSEPDPPLTKPEVRRILARLLLFGSIEVSRTFLSWIDADEAWQNAWNSLRNVYLSKESPEEVVKGHKLLKQRSEEAELVSSKLTRMILDEVQGIPRGARKPRR